MLHPVEVRTRLFPVPFSYFPDTTATGRRQVAIPDVLPGLYLRSNSNVFEKTLVAFGLPNLGGLVLGCIEDDFWE